ncbi:MAG: pre-RNA processing PIH1/Nop17-domain-containing protein [Linnemannia gamsii]|nr:MAG: pre-RNA processing PIH1/Nop17-domain-containing protein [Linnemannia gamsii]
MSFLDWDDKPTKGSSFLLNTTPSSDPNQDPSTNTNARDLVDEEALLEEFKKNPKAAMALAESYLNASQAPRQAMTEIAPVAGFVVQTRTTKQSNQVPMGNKTVVYPNETVVFINICSSDKMPQPSKATEAEIRKAIQAEEGATYQVPFQVSPPREYRDSVAKAYLVVDACIHTEPYKRAEKDFDYKLYIMELAMEWVEEKCRVELSRNFELPDMKSKDELKKRSIILPKPAAIQEIGDISGSKQSSSSVTAATNTTLSKIQEVSTPKTAKKDVSGNVVPSSGNDDIALRNRQLPCPKGTLGIVVEVDLPNHTSMEGVTLDVVLPDKLIIHSKSQGQSIDQGKEYHAEIDMPNEPLDLDNIRAEFSKAKQTLRVYTIKKKRK